MMAPPLIFKEQLIRLIAYTTMTIEETWKLIIYNVLVGV